jgi:RHS repeat-associated protein
VGELLEDADGGDGGSVDLDVPGEVADGQPLVKEGGLAGVGGGLDPPAAELGGSGDAGAGDELGRPGGGAGDDGQRSGLIYLDNRYYQPATGQFISVDLDLAQSLQPYAYAANNPLTNTDPTGLLPGGPSLCDEDEGCGNPGQTIYGTGCDAACQQATYIPPTGNLGDLAAGAIEGVIRPIADMVGMRRINTDEIKWINKHLHIKTNTVDYQLGEAAPVIASLFVAPETDAADAAAAAEAADAPTGAINAVRGTENCLACALAGDRTLSGTPASALNVEAPTDWMDISERYAGNAWRVSSGQSDIESELLDAGDGARGIVYGSRADGSAHVFNAAVQNGAVNYIDFQADSGGSFSGYRFFMFLRTQ